MYVRALLNPTTVPAYGHLSEAKARDDAPALRNAPHRLSLIGRRTETGVTHSPMDRNGSLPLVSPPYPPVKTYGPELLQEIGDKLADPAAVRINPYHPYHP